MGNCVSCCKDDVDSVTAYTGLSNESYQNQSKRMEKSSLSKGRLRATSSADYRSVTKTQQYQSGPPEQQKLANEKSLRKEGKSKDEIFQNKQMKRPNSTSSTDKLKSEVIKKIRTSEATTAGGLELSKKECELETNEALNNLKMIREEALTFIGEIEKFQELENSNLYYYIHESLKKLIDRLDDMFDIIGENKLLRDERKKVYKFILPLFDKLDEKVEQNRAKLRDKH